MNAHERSVDHAIVVRHGQPKLRCRQGGALFDVLVDLQLEAVTVAFSGGTVAHVFAAHH
jgi:hypothetical protein